MTALPERIDVPVPLLRELLAVVILVDALFAGGVLDDEDAPCVARLRERVRSVVATVDPFAGCQ